MGMENIPEAQRPRELQKARDASTDEQLEASLDREDKYKEMQKAAKALEDIEKEKLRKKLGMATEEPVA